MKKILILMTLVAVVSDYLLHPFYPQFFEIRFGVTNPKYVGYYFAAICFMVMVAFPFWAYVSKKIPELNILVYTQCIAGVLALYCFWTTSYVNFWIVSLIMILFKGSYLLVYPYILKIITKEEHPSTIGILAVVVHLGGVLGAVIGGLTVDTFHASYIFLIMAAGDFIQMGMSAFLLKSKNYNTTLITETPIEATTERVVPKSFIFKLGIVTMVLYFSDFLIRPFFAQFWQFISNYNSKLLAGLIYAIPGFVALVALWISTKTKKTYQNIPLILILIVLGVSLQSIPISGFVIVGRIIYGWAVFQGIVRFDVLVFEWSTPTSYAVDYSKVHFFQNLGVLIASFVSGILVDYYGLQLPFYVAALGVAITLVLYYLLFVFKSKSSSVTKKLINT